MEDEENSRREKNRAGVSKVKIVRKKEKIYDY
jgi:hypothetical protein